MFLKILNLASKQIQKFRNFIAALREICERNARIRIKKMIF